jgi:hypothetical protein
MSPARTAAPIQSTPEQARVLAALADSAAAGRRLSWLGAFAIGVAALASYIVGIRSHLVAWTGRLAAAGNSLRQFPAPEVLILLCRIKPMLTVASISPNSGTE